MTLAGRLLGTLVGDRDVEDTRRDMTDFAAALSDGDRIAFLAEPVTFLEAWIKERSHLAALSRRHLH